MHTHTLQLASSLYISSYKYTEMRYLLLTAGQYVTVLAYRFKLDLTFSASYTSVQQALLTLSTAWDLMT